MSSRPSRQTLYCNSPAHHSLVQEVRKEYILVLEKMINLPLFFSINFLLNSTDCSVNTKHLYNIYTMLEQSRRCRNVVEMFCVDWVYINFTLNLPKYPISSKEKITGKNYDSLTFCHNLESASSSIFKYICCGDVHFHTHVIRAAGQGDIRGFIHHRCRRVVCVAH